MSVLVPLNVQEDNSAMTQAWFEAQNEHKITSDFALAEFNSAISRLVRNRTMSDLDAAEVRQDFQDWLSKSVASTKIQSVDIQSAAKFVCTALPKLLVPDAIHLAICKRLNCTLVTFDQDLLIIAKREGVDALMPA